MADTTIKTEVDVTKAEKPSRKKFTDEELILRRRAQNRASYARNKNSRLEALARARRKNCVSTPEVNAEGKRRRGRPRRRLPEEEPLEERVPVEQAAE